MDRFMIFVAGALSAVLSEVFWRGDCHFNMVFWGGAGMLLLRRILLRFPFESKVLLCIFGAALLFVLRLTILLTDGLIRNREPKRAWGMFDERPSLSYGLYRFLLVAPAYTIIEYLEARFGM